MAKKWNIEISSSKGTLDVGTFGTVFEGKVSRPIFLGLPFRRNFKKIVVKRINKDHLNIESQDIERELAIIENVGDHPNILRYICHEIRSDSLLIATERCFGTLKAYVEKFWRITGPKLMRKKLKIKILHQVTQGLSHLHRVGIVHRDIKPTNIFFFFPKGGDWSNAFVKLADFGLHNILKISKDDLINTKIRIPLARRGWMAPEVYESNSSDFKVDIWSLGCIFCYVLSKGKHPFGNDNIDERITRIIRQEPMLLVQDNLKKSYSKDGIAFALIQTMLEIKPSKRPAIADVEKSAIFSLFSEYTENCD